MNIITFKEAEDLLLKSNFIPIKINRKISLFESKKQIAYIIYLGAGKGFETVIYNRSNYCDCNEIIYNNTFTKICAWCGGVINSKAELEKELKQTEKCLDKIRGTSVLSDGWQTCRFSKKSRTWDILAIRKNEIIRLLNRYV